MRMRQALVRGVTILLFGRRQEKDSNATRSSLKFNSSSRNNGTSTDSMVVHVELSTIRSPPLEQDDTTQFDNNKSTVSFNPTLGEEPKSNSQLPSQQDGKTNDVLDNVRDVETGVDIVHVERPASRLNLGPRSPSSQIQHSDDMFGKQL